MGKGTYKSLQKRIDLKQQYPCDMGLLNVVNRVQRKSVLQHAIRASCISSMY